MSVVIYAWSCFLRNHEVLQDTVFTIGTQSAFYVGPPLWAVTVLYLAFFVCKHYESPIMV